MHQWRLGRRHRHIVVFRLASSYLAQHDEANRFSLVLSVALQNIEGMCLRFSYRAHNGA